MPVPDSVARYLPLVDKAVDSTARDREVAERRLAEARLALQAWQRVRDGLSGGHYADALFALTSLDDQGIIFDPSHPHRAVAEELRAALAPQAREAAARFGRDFPSLARGKGLEIDRTSRHP